MLGGISINNFAVLLLLSSVITYSQTEDKDLFNLLDNIRAVPLFLMRSCPNNSRLQISDNRKINLGFLDFVKIVAFRLGVFYLKLPTENCNLNSAI